MILYRIFDRHQAQSGGTFSGLRPLKVPARQGVSALRRQPSLQFQLSAQAIDSYERSMTAPRVALTGQAIPAYARTAGRAVHVKIHPRPRNLGESREVLRVLQQYGDVVMYKHLKVR